MSRVVVTGGAGYIGSHTCVALLTAGHEVLVVDDLRRSHARILDGIAAITGRPPAVERIDVADARALTAALVRWGRVDAVVHLAAYKSVRESVAHPTRYYGNNIGATVAVLDAMSAVGCGRMVFSSSCTVYGQPDRLPVTEDTPLAPPQSPYGATKQMCERILADASAAGMLSSSVSLRYFNPAGAHPSALIGELPLGVPDNLVPFITQTAAGWRSRLEIFGTDYPTPDGTAVRDYLHVVDLADAHLAALDAVLAGPVDLRAYNLGAGRGVSVREVVDAFEQATGVPVPVTMSPRRPGDVTEVWASPQRAVAELGWTARRPLAEIVASAWAWQQTLGPQPPV